MRIEVQGEHLHDLREGRDFLKGHRKIYKLGSHMLAK